MQENMTNEELKKEFYKTKEKEAEKIRNAFDK